MKKFLLVLSLGLMFGLAACKEAKPVVDPLCDIAVKSLTGAAQGVADALSCSNVPAIAAALTKPVTELSVCAEGQAGMVGDLVCPQISKFVVNLGVSALPADWGCTGGTLSAESGKLIAEQCQKFVTF